MNRADAISATELWGGEREPDPCEDICIDCGAVIPVGFLRCADCDDKHEEFLDHATDPRR
jgi:hypothetical protein